MASRKEGQRVRQSVTVGHKAEGRGEREVKKCRKLHDFIFEWPLRSSSAVQDLNVMF